MSLTAAASQLRLLSATGTSIKRLGSKPPLFADEIHGYYMTGLTSSAGVERVRTWGNQDEVQKVKATAIAAIVTVQHDVT